MAGGAAPSGVSRVTGLLHIHAAGMPWEWPASFFPGASATPASVVIIRPASCGAVCLAFAIYVDNVGEHNDI
jgi:hypothetical protein